MKKTLLLISALSLLTACGEKDTDRIMSGAAIGAGVGAVGGTLISGDPVSGAVVGGAVGAAAGGIINKSKLNLGKPIWE